MLWWIAIAALLILAVMLLFRRKWVAPWQELERLVSQIARGQQPRTFLVSGNRHAWRIAVGLEDLLKHQQQLGQQLSSDGAEMRAVFAALSDPLVVLDHAQRVRFSNPAFEQLFRPALPGTPMLEALRSVEISELVRSALDKREFRSAELSHSGKAFQLVAVPIVHEHEEAAGIVAIFHDVSRLKQTDEIRRDFVANVSHELRTPLSIFRGNLETLLEEPKLEEKERTHIYEVMKRHSNRLNLLAEDLLNLARLESKEAPLQIAAINLPDFLGRVTRDWEKQLAAKNLRLQLDAPAELPPLHADEFRLEQVLDNLLDNAVNYSRASGQIVVAANEKQNEIELSVSDEGVGIPADDLPRIFERFYRADRARSRERGGIGLGLSIVKHIVLLHGGRVQAESELERGSTIRVFLPNKIS